MGLFEKIKFEPVEMEETVDIAHSTKKWTDETFSIEYPLLMKCGLLIFPLIMLPILQGLLEEGFFLLELAAVAGVIAGVWYVVDCLATRGFTFSPDGIVKRGIIGRTTLPAKALLMTVDNQNIRFFHGSEKNIRESVTIHRYFIGVEDVADIVKYADDVYHVSANAKRAGSSEKGNAHTSKLALIEFQKAVSSYRSMAAFFFVYAVIAFFAISCSEKFNGFAPELPSLPVRLACIGLAIAGFLLVRRMATASGQDKGPIPLPVEVRLKRAESSAFISAATASAMACLGLVLLLLFGNTLDFYLFMLIGVLCFYDYYPRLSIWEQSVHDEAAAKSAKEESVISPRRSLQVSLVLMGALAVASQGESRHYIYNSRQDCLNDWGDGNDCKEAPPESSHYGTHAYYGPSYGSGGGRATRAMGVGTISRGGFGSLGGFHASFGG